MKLSGSTSKLVRSHLLLVATVLAVSACSKGPSEGEIKEAMENALGIRNCKFVSLANFKKVNGIAQGEQYYDVAVSYTVEAVPELKTLIELEKQLEQAEQDELYFNANSERLREAERLLAIPGGSEEENARYIAEIIELKENADSRKEANDKLKPKPKPKLIEDIKVLNDKSKKQEGLDAGCYSVGIDLNKSSSRQVDDHRFRMIKTDNGWMMAR